MHRLEIMFTADVPEDEMERATILAHPDVVAAKATLGKALAEAGAKGVKSTTKSVKPAEGRKPRGAAVVVAARHAAE